MYNLYRSPATFYECLMTTATDWHQLTKIKYTKTFVKQKTQVGDIYYIVNLKPKWKLIGNLTKKSNEKYYKTYFQENKNNLYKTWKGIKEVIFFKKTNNVQPHSL